SRWPGCRFRRWTGRPRTRHWTCTCARRTCASARRAGRPWCWAASAVARTCACGPGCWKGRIRKSNWSFRWTLARPTRRAARCGWRRSGSEHLRPRIKKLLPCSGRSGYTVDGAAGGEHLGPHPHNPHWRLRMKLSKLASLAVVLSTVIPFAASAQDEGEDSPLTWSVAAVSDYVWRGVSQSDEEPTVQAGLTWTAPVGVYVGVWGSG